MLNQAPKIALIINQFESYLKAALKIKTKVKKWEGEKNLPLYLRQLYSFHETKFLNSKILLMVALPKEEFTTTTIALNMLRLKEFWKYDLIFVNGALSSLSRMRLLEKQIPFVIPGNQMFLPMLGVDLREHFKKIQVARPELSPSTQLLVLDAIYTSKKTILKPKDAAKKFNYTPMTMTRVFNELELTELVNILTQNKSRQLQFKEGGQDLWAKVLPFLKSPVKKRVLLKSDQKNKLKILSGYSALAKYSNLSHSSVKVFAVDKSNWGLINKIDLPTNNYVTDPGEIEVEQWSYSPSFLSKGGICDPLSIFLAFKDSDDERVQQALEELLAGVEWS